MTKAKHVVACLCLQYTCTYIYIYIKYYTYACTRYAQVYASICTSKALYTDKYIADYGGLLLGFCSCTGLRLCRRPLCLGAKIFHSKGLELYKYIIVHLYKYKKTLPWETMCCIIPGYLCVASPLGNYVLDHSREIICCISPGKLCVVCFGPQLLGPRPWLPVLVRCFGPQFWADRAHGPLGQYVLHHPWETMCWITPGKPCVGSPLGA